jgi:alpha-L-rhamnosidase
LQHYFTTILGIQPAAWGFRRVEIRPQPGPLTWASGRLVHPAGGEIVVELRRGADALRGRIVLPANLAGTLVLQGGTRPLEAGETLF